MIFPSLYCSLHVFTRTLIHLRFLSGVRVTRFLSGVRVTRSLSGVRVTRSLSGVRVTGFFEGFVLLVL